MGHYVAMVYDYVFQPETKFQIFQFDSAETWTHNSGTHRQHIQVRRYTNWATESSLKKDAQKLIVYIGIPTYIYLLWFPINTPEEGLNRGLNS